MRVLLALNENFRRERVPSKECGDLHALVGGPKLGQVTALQRALLYLA